MGDAGRGPIAGIGPVSWSDALVVTESRRLASGLQVLILDTPGRRNTLCLSHIRGGSRSDPVGRAGMAHLSEHLLTQGVRDDGERWVTPIVATGGDVTATTHPDYLEFCAEGPLESLPWALRAECARLTEWPRLRDGEFEKQRDGVCTEIQQHVSQRASRSLPWPDLGVRTFGSWRDGHDPFGEVGHVFAMNALECQRFSEVTHHPHAAAVVVAADLRALPGGAEGVFDALSAVPARPDGPALTREESPGPVDSAGLVETADWAAPHSVGALAWRVPSVVDDPEAYAGLLALGRYLGLTTANRGKLGHTVPMDRAGEDAFTITATHATDAEPTLRYAQDQIASVADRRGKPDELTAAVAQAQADVAELLDRPRTAAQLLGRATLLAHSAAAAGHWVEAVHDADPDSVVAAARLLADSSAVGLVGRPSRLPTRRFARSMAPSPARASAPSVTPVTARGTRHARPSAPATTVAFERASLTSSIAARLTLAPAAALDRSTRDRLSANGIQSTSDIAGWLLTGTAVGTAYDLAAKTRDALGGGYGVRHAVLVGPAADQAEPWPRRVDDALAAAGERTDPSLMVQPPHDGTPPDVAGAQLRWFTDGDGFIERWLAIALLADIQARAHGQDPATLAAPPETALSLRQEARPGHQALVFEAWSAPERLADTLIHLATELDEPRLEQRATRIVDTAAAVAGQWLRDHEDAATLARRATTMLDLGARAEDVQSFHARVQAISGGAVVERVLADTSGSPAGWVRTSRPDLLDRADLPWLPQPATVG